MKTIAFICTANICRSLMAHAIFVAEAARRGLQVEVLSAGLAPAFEGMAAAGQARNVCDLHKTPLPKTTSTHIRHVDLSRATRVFAMEHGHVDVLIAQLSLSPERICLLGEFDPHHRGVEIENPMGQDSVEFERCYEHLRDCIIHYLNTTDECHSYSVGRPRWDRPYALQVSKPRPAAG